MKQFKEDEIIVRQGEITNEMYKVVYGKAAVYLDYGEKDEHLLGIVSEQKCFGEFGVLSHIGEPYTVIAVTDILLLSIKADDLEGFIRENPRDALLIMRNMLNMIDIMKTNLDLLRDELYHAGENSIPVRKISDIEAGLRKYTLFSKAQSMQEHS